MSEAASPYGLPALKTQCSEPPELVLLRRAPDGREAARFRYFEPAVGPPYMRSLFPHDGAVAEQAEIERHKEERLAPVMLDVFSLALWLSLAEGPENQPPSS